MNGCMNRSGSDEGRELYFVGGPISGNNGWFFLPQGGQINLFDQILAAWEAYCQGLIGMFLRHVADEVLAVVSEPMRESLGDAQTKGQSGLLTLLKGMVRVLRKLPESGDEDPTWATMLEENLVALHVALKSSLVPKALSEVVFCAESEESRRVAFSVLRACFPDHQLICAGWDSRRDWERPISEPRSVAEFLANSRREATHKTVWSGIVGDELWKWAIFERALGLGMPFTETSGNVLKGVVEQGVVSPQVVYNSLATMRRYQCSHAATQYLGFLLQHLPGEFAPLIV